MAADLAHAHAARIHGDDLVVEIGKTALIFGDQLWIEGASPIPRNRQGHLRRARQYRLLRGAIATIGVAPAFTLALKVLVKFGAQNALRQRLLQIVDETARGKNLGRIAARQKPVQQFFLNSHVMSLLSIIMASSTKFLTVPGSAARASVSGSSRPACGRVRPAKGRSSAAAERCARR